MLGTEHALLLGQGLHEPAVLIRPYEQRDERGWLICRLLSFFDTAFFDAVEREKERYERDAIELVAEKNARSSDYSIWSERATVCRLGPEPAE
jgi:hypothetical protein